MERNATAGLPGVELDMPFELTGSHHHRNRSNCAAAHLRPEAALAGNSLESLAKGLLILSQQCMLALNQESETPSNLSSEANTDGNMK